MARITDVAPTNGDGDRYAMGLMQRTFVITTSLSLMFFASCMLPAQTPDQTSATVVAKTDESDDKGLALLNERCTACHAQDLIVAQRKSPDDWAATVHDMTDRGAVLSKEEMDVVIEYLSLHYSE